MSKKKLLVFNIDALCTCDIEQMKTLKHFAPFFERGAYVRVIEPVYPTMTYTCHTSILTGTYVNKHGIPQNEDVKRGKLQSPWFCMKADVKAPTLLDFAREAGYSTCSISWPVSGGADYNFNMPMIVPYNYKGWEPEPYLRDTATKKLMEQYWWKYGRFQMGEGRSLDHYTMSIAPDLLRDFGQPDVMLVKMCDLDSARHMYGVYSEEASEQLRRHNEEFGVLLECVRRYGDYENTNFVIMGDHGQTDVEDVLNMNILLRDKGFIRVNENNELISYDALCHSLGMSAWIELSNPEDKEMYRRVHDFLLSLADDPTIQLAHVFDKETAEKQFGLTGPFDFVIESKRNLSFWEGLKEPDIFKEKIPGHKHIGRGSHGGLPDRVETTTFMAFGPRVKKGAIIEKAKMVDEAPTMARMLGLNMTGTDGKVLEDLIEG